MISLKQIADLLGGTVTNGEILCPGPHHSPMDRSLSIRPQGNTLDGFIFYSYACDDKEVCLELIKSKIGHLLPLSKDLDTGTKVSPDEAVTANSDEGLNDAAAKVCRGRNPDHIYLYRDISGLGILQAVARWNEVDGGKKIRPFYYNGKDWVCRAYPGQRPLYNLNTLASDPDSNVLVVEGERAAEAASSIYPGIATTWAGGAKNIKKSDFSPLIGRKVTLWPDNDEAGKMAMEAVALILIAQGTSVRIIDLDVLAKHRPKGEPLSKGWDVADAIEEGWEHERLVTALSASTKFVAPVAHPQPQPLYPELPQPKPYPVEALGETLARVTEAIANKCQVPCAMAAQSVLGVASLAVQSHANLEMPYGQTRPINLYLVTIASSGDRKSTADNEALLGVSAYEKVLRTRYDEELPDFYAAEVAYNAEKRKIELSKDKNFKREDRQRAVKELGAKPEKPLHPILTIADTTLEGLIKNWPDMHAGLGLFSAEGGQFTGGHGMAEENRLRTSAHLSCFWDGTQVKRVRAGDGAIWLHGRRLTFHLMLQPQAAAGFLSDPVLRDQGLLSRVLVAAPESLAGTRLHKPIDVEDEAAIDAFKVLISSILNIPKPLAEGKRNELEPRTLIFDGGAKEIFYQFSDNIERQMGKGGSLEGLKDVGAKIPENAARIAAVLTLVDNIAARSVPTEIMYQAMQLADWYLGEADRLNEARRTDPQLVMAQDLLDWTLASGLRQINQRDIMRNGPKKLRTKASLKPILAILVDHHWLTQLADGNYLVAKKEAV